MKRAEFLTTLFNNSAQAEGSEDLNDDLFHRFANKTLPTQLKTTSSGLDTYRGAWNRQMATHLLRRTTFGLRDADIDFIQSLGTEQAVDFLLAAPTTIPDPPVNNYAPDGDLTQIPFGSTWVDAPFGDPGVDAQRSYSLKSWWLELINRQGLNITERMVLFWHSHFVTEISTVLDSRLSYRYCALLRSLALGNFKELCREMSMHPAMLLYLNGYLNSKFAPDENYARELQELFTVGKAGATTYTEDDVKAAAKILTGWRFSPTTQESYFQPSRHDDSDKQFSSFYDNAIITGRSDEHGAEELDELIDMLFAKRETALNICRKLYRYFVYYVIDNEIENNIIQPMADLLIDNNFVVKPVIGKLLKSQHFYDVSFHGCYIKSPIELIAGAFRTFYMDIPPGTPIDQSLTLWKYLWSYAIDLGQHIGEPTNVAGWPAYRQSPQFYQVWINSNTTPRRVRLMDMLLTTGINVDNAPVLQAGILEFAKRCTNAADPTNLTSYCVELMLGYPLDPEFQKELKTVYLLSGLNTDAYWTSAWNMYIANPDPANEGVVTTRLTSLIVELSHMAEFQLC